MKPNYGKDLEAVEKRLRALTEEHRQLVDDIMRMQGMRNIVSHNDELGEQTLKLLQKRFPNLGFENAVKAMDDIVMVITERKFKSEEEFRRLDAKRQKLLAGAARQAVRKFQRG